MRCGIFLTTKNLLVIMIMALLVLTSILATTEAVTTDEIDSKQQELEGVEERKKERKDALEQSLNREVALKEELKILEQRLHELQEEQQRLNNEIAAVEDEIAQAEDELSEAEARLSYQEELLNLRLRAIQQYGVVSYIDVLFESSSFPDFLTRLYNLSIIASNDLRLIEEIQSERDVIRAWKDELEQKKASLENMHRQVATNEQEMRQAASDREAILAELQSEIAKNIQIIDDLEKEAQRLDSMIRELIAQAQSQFSGLEGELHWPIEPPTRITSGFGWRRDPFSGHQAWHGGIDIAPHGGAANYILAAARGEVIYSGWNGGYGNCVMIDHGGGTVTLYGHMSSLLVSKGDIVDRGQRIARAGTTGYSTGVHLHFEVREYEKAPVRSYPGGGTDHRYNPMEYY